MMISKLTGIYKIENIITNDIYVGSAASSFTKRWSRHRVDLKNNRHPNPILQNAYNKYGEEAFEYTVLEVCSKIDCIKQEQFYIDELKPSYNILKMAGSALGHVVPLDTRLKISNTMKGRQFSKQHKKNLSNAAKGNKNGRFCKGKKRRPYTEKEKLEISIRSKLAWERKKKNEY